VLELLCRREARAVFEAEGLQCLLTFVNANASTVHRDSLQCSLSVASMLCGRLKPDHPALSSSVASLTAFLEHKDNIVVDHALESLGSLITMFARAQVDPEPLNEFGLLSCLLRLLVARQDGDHGEHDTSFRTGKVVSLVLNLARASEKLAHELLSLPIISAIQMVRTSRKNRKPQNSEPECVETQTRMCRDPNLLILLTPLFLSPPFLLQESASQLIPALGLTLAYTTAY